MQVVLISKLAYVVIIAPIFPSEVDEYSLTHHPITAILVLSLRILYKATVTYSPPPYPLLATNSCNTIHVAYIYSVAPPPPLLKPVTTYYSVAWSYFVYLNRITFKFIAI